jgi:AcrR family transcriptional regulator
MANLRERKAIAAKMSLMKAIGKILREKSYSKLSINLVSEESGVDKAFIYRHYESFEGLLKSYIERQDHWLMNLEEVTKIPIEDHRQFMKDLLTNQFLGVYENEEFQQFLVWELGDKAGFTAKVSVQREILAKPIFEQCRTVFKDYRIDLNVIYAWWSAGIYFLILHKDVSTFCEYDFTKKQDIDEFLKTLRWMVDLLFDKLEADKKIEEMALKAHQKGLPIEDVAEITGLSNSKVRALVHAF